MRPFGDRSAAAANTRLGDGLYLAATAEKPDMNVTDLILVFALVTAAYGVVTLLARHGRVVVEAVNRHRVVWFIAGSVVFAIGVVLVPGATQSGDMPVWGNVLRPLRVDAPPRALVAWTAIVLGLACIAVAAWCRLALPRAPSSFRCPRDRRAAVHYYVARPNGGLCYALLASGDGVLLEEEADARKMHADCPHLPSVSSGDELPRCRTPADQIQYWRDLAGQMHRRVAELDALIQCGRQGRSRRIALVAEYGGIFFRYVRPPDPLNTQATSLYLFAATISAAEVDRRRADHHFQLLLEALLNIELSDPVTRHMRKDFARLRDGETASQALARLRQHLPEGRVTYFYVVDAENRLLGVVPTRQLLLSPPESPVRDIMVKPVIAVPHTATVLDACEFFTLHKLLAFPVVDDEQRVLGLVEVELYTDELIDIDRWQGSEDLFQLIGVHLVEARKGDLHVGFRQRFPWLLANIGGGLLAGALAAVYEDVTTLAVVVPFIPVVLALSEGVSIQSVSLALETMQGWRPTWAGLAARLRRELATGLVLGGACGLLVGLVALAWMRSAGLAASLLGGIACGVGAAAVFGLGLPLVLRILRRDPQVAAGPIALTGADLVALLVYFNLARWLLH
jgi:magnesium transporter